MDWVRDKKGKALVLPVVAWVVDSVPEASEAHLRIDYGLNGNGQALALVQLTLTPDQLLDLARDLSAAATGLRQTLESEPVRKRA